MTSPLDLVPKAIQVWGLIEFLMNRPLPSPIRTLTPPGWLLWRVGEHRVVGAAVGQESRQSFHGAPLGVTTVLKSDIPTAPQAQRLPLSVVMLPRCWPSSSGCTR